MNPAGSLRAREAVPDDLSDDAVLELLSTLDEQPRRIDPVYLYDERGSALFEEICEQPEYYLTRAELEILEREAPAIAELIGPAALIVEPGSGSGRKTRLLLHALREPAGYMPVDVAAMQLIDTARTTARQFPGLPIRPVLADFTRPFGLPGESRRARRVVFFFPGSTIGNFSPRAARALLRSFRELAGSSGVLVVGVDLLKEEAVLRAAYNDSAGVTANFNLNVLAHINHRFAADFDLSAFRHAAPWDADRRAIEMQLWCTRRQRVRVGPRRLVMDSGDRIVTEWCHKYTVEEFADLARGAGWWPHAVWLDARGYFSVQYFTGERLA